ncbi:hypothetical protein WN59_09970 [Salinicoccus sediminis]|uniref:HNH nuclease domain-containing protein n=1 Tax=Salinicoccus sediminis TaxID=1432562 RepID=A0A0M2SMV1_9STAP|nr:HNH endonuclease [Salinicoccus sediminis]KKK33925.1 hypothetical protein WN59_09970 [Salinicoccus sediminis]
MNKSEEFKYHFKKRLLEEYPNKVIKGYNPDTELMTVIKNFCNLNSLDYKEEIKKLGINMVRKNTILESEIPETLLNYFPDKILTSLSEIKAAHSKLDSQLTKYSKDRNISKETYLEHLGFKLVKKSKSKYDYVSIKELKNNYNFNLAKHAKAFGISRQAMNAKIIDKSFGKRKAEIREVKHKHKKLIIKMVDSLTNELSNSDGTVIHIYKHNKKEKNAIFIKEGETHNYIFDIPSDINILLKNAYYDRLKNDDYNNIAKVKKLLKNYEEYSNIDLPSDDFRLVKKTAESIGISIDNLTKLIKTNQVISQKDNRTNSKEEIILILEKFLLADGVTVSLPSENNQAQTIRQRASRQGLSVQTFIESYGYKYSRLNEEDNVYVSELKNIIKEKYLVNEDKIYIPPYGSFFRNIYARARNKGKNLETFLYEIGFVRIYKKDLPEGYTPYDWTKDDISLQDDESYIDEIKKYFMFEGKVYIPSSEYFYDKLFLFSTHNKRTVSEQLKVWGFDRTFIPPKNFESNEIKDNESPYKISLIDDIKEIQSKLNYQVSEIEKVNRSKELVSKLKRLYHYECQLCGLESENKIVNPDGTFYIEVHHINPIHTAKTYENEEENKIDHYKNVICLCPYHHKFVHFHEGGNFKLNDSKTALMNDKNTVLQIKLDYHLT